MERYDPEATPIPEEWRELDESDRIELVEQYHRDARVRIPRAARRLHASLHVAVENQLAEADEPVVRAFDRVRKEGLSRHDAIHALGSVWIEHIFNVLQPDARDESPDTSRAHFYAAIERLTASSWRTDQG